LVYALNSDGTLKWSHQTVGGSGERSVIQTSPAIGGDGTLYISGWIGDPQPTMFFLYAFGPAP
jgi:outer membrane protein assembly factor BamB